MPYRAACAGDLIHPLLIEQKVETQSASGALTPTWQTVGTFWGRMNLQKGREQTAADQVQSVIDGEATIRYTESVTANMRLTFKSKHYDILAVTPDDRFADHLVLTLTQGATAG